MDKKEIIIKTKEFVKKTLRGDSGHNYDHIKRVFNNTTKIWKKEGGDLFIIHLACLLHDTEDWKFGRNKTTVEKFLNSLTTNKKIITNILSIIKGLSFKGALVKSQVKTREGKIVQDADRLDAMGAIGIARVFNYGGYKNREIYNPKIKPKMHESVSEYRYGKSTTINHFYEKLLLLKNLMNTKTGKKLAIKRHKFMKKYLKQFFKEIKT